MKMPPANVKKISSFRKIDKKNKKIYSLVEFYRKIKGIDKKQMKCLTGRLMGRAKTILMLYDYDLVKSKKIILVAKNYFDSNGLNWGLEAVIKNFHILEKKSHEWDD